MEDKLFIGFDLSTQQLKAVVINGKLRVVVSECVQFDTELPEYRTDGGVHGKDSRDGRITSPTLMWVKAVDMLMDKIRIAGIDFSQVAAISGAGQQHGSVYWKVGAEKILNGLKASEGFLHSQLGHAFSVSDSPVWMDSSTSKECANLEKAVGGAQSLANITGSSAYERFTGAQISKIANEKSEQYANTERISLVSSFLASIFIGKYAPIDASDAGGMNLLDLKTMDWSQQCLDACGGDLRNKLGQPVPSQTDIGPISSYMIERYGFVEGCRVVAFTGDNPSSLAGLRMQSGDVAISLGTSDTIFVWLENFKEKEVQKTNEVETTKPEGGNQPILGHIFPNPVDREAYMALICYKNGSLTREKIRDEISLSAISEKWPQVEIKENQGDKATWDVFNQLLDITPRGNFGNIGMYYTLPEITPAIKVPGDYRFNKANDRLNGKFAGPQLEARALIEGQFMAKRIHAVKMGLNIDVGKSRRILVTGGASANDRILQIISDVFNAPVYIQQETANSAALGGCYRALHVYLGGEQKQGYAKSLAEIEDQSIGPSNDEESKKSAFVLRAKPNSDAESVYKSLLSRFETLEDSVALN